MRLLRKFSAVIVAAAIFSSISLFSSHSDENLDEAVCETKEGGVHISVEGGKQTFWLPHAYALDLNEAERLLKENGYVAHNAEGTAGTYKGGTGGPRGEIRIGLEQKWPIIESKHQELATQYINERISTLKHNISISGYSHETLESFWEELISLENERDHQFEQIMKMMKDGTIYILIQCSLGQFLK